MQVATQQPPPPPGGFNFPPPRQNFFQSRFTRPYHSFNRHSFRHQHRPRMPGFLQQSQNANTTPLGDKKESGGAGSPSSNATGALPVPPEVEYDGKTLRKAVQRKTVDYNSAIIKYLEMRVWQRDTRDHMAVQSDVAYCAEVMPPVHYADNPMNAVTTRFVRTSTNKMRCPIFCVSWTPEGRRLITGASSGEFTLWNGLTFNFETILQAHDGPVRSMEWSHNDNWMVTGDTAGYVKYWQSNMNNVKMFQAHKEPCRSISFCPTDQKLVTASDDGTVRIWDFFRCHEDKILRGHGAEVKCVDWHPQKALIVSGSKDSQQPVKLWDPKTGKSLATLHAHKSTVMDVRWNQNGNWLVTVSRDHLVKLYDVRKLSQEMQTFRGHKKEVSVAAWNPIHENLLATGGSDGSILFWNVGADKEVGCIDTAHDSIIWSMQWHPLGHILCSGSNDHTCKFWTRNKPGDRMRDRYNLNTMPAGMAGVDDEYDDIVVAIPGMGMDQGLTAARLGLEETLSSIPGLDIGAKNLPPGGFRTSLPLNTQTKKVPHAKPIDRQFQQQWMENRRPTLAAPMNQQQHFDNSSDPDYDDEYEMGGDMDDREPLGIQEDNWDNNRPPFHQDRERSFRDEDERMDRESDMDLRLMPPPPAPRGGRGGFHHNVRGPPPPRFNNNGFNQPPSLLGGPRALLPRPLLANNNRGGFEDGDNRRSFEGDNNGWDDEDDRMDGADNSGDFREEEDWAKNNWNDRNNGPPRRGKGGNFTPLGERRGRGRLGGGRSRGGDGGGRRGMGRSGRGHKGGNR